MTTIFYLLNRINEKVNIMNIGYIYDIISKKLVAIIATNKEQIAYYSPDSEINQILAIILLKENIVGLYGFNENKHILIADIVKNTEKSFLHGLSYLLPFPYHIDKLEYSDINIEDLPIIYKNMEG